MAERLAVVLRETVPADAAAACRAGSPRRAVLGGELVYHFYDRRGRPLSEGAPPLDARLLEPAGRRHRDGGSLRRLVAGVARVGPLAVARGACELAEAPWPARWLSEPHGLRVIIETG